MNDAWPGTALTADFAGSATSSEPNQPARPYPADHYRADGSLKGSGFLGEIKRPDGKISTEISIGVPMGGKETEIPTMVPGLNPEELQYLLNTDPAKIQNGPLFASIRDKAVAHAQQRIAQGLSPFKQDGEDSGFPGQEVGTRDANGSLDIGDVVVDVGQPAQPESSVGEDMATGLGKGARNTLHGVAAFADLLGLPAAAVMRMLGADIQPLTDLADQASDAIGLPKNTTGFDKAAQSIYDGSIAGLGTAGVGGALAGAGGVTGAVGEALAATPVADAVSGGSGTLSGELTRQAGGGPIAQFAASLVGGGLGAAASMAPRKVASMLPGNRAPNALSSAATDLGIDLLPADAGGPTVRRLTGGAAQLPLSAAPIVEAGQRAVAQAKTARDHIGAMFGEVGSVESAGEASRSGALSYIKNSGKQGGRLYDQAAKLSADTRVPLPNAIAAVDDQIARLKEVPGGGKGLADLESLRVALEREGGFSVQGIRDMRTEMFVVPELRGSPSERRLRQVVDAASTDIEQGLIAQGDADAAKAFRAADDYWKARLATIDKVIRPIVGKDGETKGAEDIYKAVNAATKGNAERLARFMAALPDEDANLVRATLINRLGLATKGAQNAEGDAFSLGTFLNNWNELTPRSKVILFGKDAREALEKLATVAEGTRGAERYANHPNTSGSIAAQVMLTGGAGLGGLGTLIPASIAQYGAGKLLASPRFARWLASAPKKPNGPATLAHINRLTAIAAAEPTIGNEVLRLQERLASAFTNTPASAAAEEQSNAQ